MARARTIKPGFFTNEHMAELPLPAQLLFIGLLTIADREGRLEDRPKRIKANIFPYSDFEVEPLLGALESSDFIVRYEIDGARYIQIPKWKKHQNPHPKEAMSAIPPVPVGWKKQVKTEVDENKDSRLITWPSREKDVARSGKTGTSNAFPSGSSGSSDTSATAVAGESPSTDDPPFETTEPGDLFELDGGPTQKRVRDPTSKELQKFWFDKEVWPPYWIHKGKKEAFDTFSKIATTEETKNRIVKAIHNQRAEMLAKEPSRRKWMQGWLNGERFEDALESEAPLATPPPEKRFHREMLR